MTTTTPARASVLSVGDEHPEVADDFGMLALDEHGHCVGSFVLGSEIMAQAERSRRSRAM